MTTIAAFCPLSLQTLFDVNVVPIKGGKLYFYDAGTTTPRTVYRDSALAMAHSTPVRTDAYGRIPPIYVGLGLYKIVLKDSADALISQVDGLPGATDSGTDPSPSTDVVWTSGDIKIAFSNSAQDGWLWANGQTVGNASSAGTARADADISDLFTKLWNTDSTLAVSGGRGSTAASDFAAAKTIALPDFRGRTFFGVDGMGTALATRITAATVATPNVIGSHFGAENVVLSTGQLASHTHATIIAAAGAHTPAGTMDVQGNHYHSGTTASNGNHTHVIASTAVVAAAGTARGIFGGGVTDQGTNTAGIHNHSFDTAPTGGHTHTITMAGVDPHVHSATAASVGANQAHANMPPGILVYVFIKL
jgi:microcystin-dependent protein